MKPIHLVVAASVMPWLGAQEAPKSPRPPQITADSKSGPCEPAVLQRPALPAAATAAARPEDATRDARLRTIANDPQLLAWDQPRPDADLWVAAQDFKAAFAGDRWTFIARPASPEAASQPLTLRLGGARCGGVACELQPGTPVRAGNEVRIARGGLTEVFDAAPTGVEQSFVFAALPARGDLVLELELQTALAGKPAADGFDFAGAATTVHCSAVTATDARGASIRAAAALEDGRLVVTVPAAFVADAVLPLVVDPLLSSIVPSTSTFPLTNVDLAWDENYAVWVACWERQFSATDSDVFAVRLSAQMLQVGPLMTVDVSSTAWERPRIADNRLHAKLLVVAQLSAGKTSPYWIGGRVLTPTGSVGSQLDIEKAGLTNHAIGDKLHPDVAGDPSLVAPTFFTVVWERVYSTTDHDIHLKQVDENGQLRHDAPTLLDNSTWDDSDPAVAKSDGPAPASDQVTAVTFLRTPRFGPNQTRGSFVTWDGQLGTFGGETSFPVHYGVNITADVAKPAVSSPSLGGGSRRWLFAAEAGPTVATTLVDATGTVHADTSLPVLLGQAGLPHQYAPRVDSDGCRFALVWQQSVANLNYDTKVCLLAALGNALVVHEQPLALGQSLAPEMAPAVGSVYSGSGTADTRYGLADTVLASPSSVECWAYDGIAPGGIAMRTAGCGGLTTVPAGRPVLGETFTLTLTDSNGPGGFVGGSPIPTTVFGPCPTCTTGVVGDALFGTTLNITVPLSPVLVGGTVAFQGFALQGGTCFGSVRIGNVYDVTVQ